MSWRSENPACPTKIARACFEALTLKRDVVCQHALRYSWEAPTRQFFLHLHPVRKSDHIPVKQAASA